MKKIFKKDKELTPEQNRDFLESSGVPIKTQSTYRKNKFSQFSDVASRLNQSKSNSSSTRSSPGPSGSNPYATSGNSSANPYAGSNDRYGNKSQESRNPYANASGEIYGQNNMAGSNPRRAQSPYESSGYANSYSATRSNYVNNNTSSSSSTSPYAAAASTYSNRFGNQELRRTETSDTDTVNKRSELFKGAAGISTTTATVASTNNGSSSFPLHNNSAQDELFERPSDLDRSYNNTNNYHQEQTQKYDSEDEDVEQIKGQIRFTKQESVNSTRNALRVAAEAEESGRNTLGMLGSQGESIANTESSLALAETQNRIAEEKAKELKIANRSMFAVHVSNPFNSKRKQEEQEALLKQQRAQEQISRESRRRVAYDSEQRVMGGLNNGPSNTALKYRNQSRQGTVERQKYQFEADSEDEEMENEIDNNLDALHDASGRLRKLAIATNEEVSKQNDRLDNIANKTDDLDVNVHLNTSRLANIK